MPVCPGESIRNPSERSPGYPAVNHDTNIEVEGSAAERDVVFDLVLESEIWSLGSMPSTGYRCLPACLLTGAGVLVQTSELSFRGA